MRFTAPLRPHVIGKATYRVLVLPPDVDAALRKMETKRVVVTLNDTLTYQGAVLSRGPGRGRYVMVNVEQRKTLGLAEDQMVQVRLAIDDSPYGMPVPVAFQTLLEEDAALQTAFDALTPPMQRRLLYTVGKPKLETTRLQKAVGAAAYLEEVGSEEFTYPGLLAWLRKAGNDLKQLY